MRFLNTKYFNKRSIDMRRYWDDLKEWILVRDKNTWLKVMTVSTMKAPDMSDWLYFRMMEGRRYLELDRKMFLYTMYAITYIEKHNYQLFQAYRMTHRLVRINQFCINIADEGKIFFSTEYLIFKLLRSIVGKKL
jgi:hypothetical protein